jgi:hypothetical protein
VAETVKTQPNINAVLGMANTKNILRYIMCYLAKHSRDLTEEVDRVQG